MKIVHKEYIVRQGRLATSSTINALEHEIEQAVTSVVWPPGADGFYLDPSSKRRKPRGQRQQGGNGVKPIKDAFVLHLRNLGWQPERMVRKQGVAGTGPLDLVRSTACGWFAAEWETGNISSSHRAVNKICLGILDNELTGGALILPSRDLYPYLTDRVGNYRELEPYLPLWKRMPFNGNGVLVLVVIEYDGLKPGVPQIAKGTDGRALA